MNVKDIKREMKTNNNNNNKKKENKQDRANEQAGVMHDVTTYASQ